MAIIGAIGIILMGGRESKNWFKRILKGCYALYNVTGYLSDLLSYSRLLALGLATSVISSVFNKMGSMVAGTPVLGVVFFILIFLVGHTINLAYQCWARTYILTGYSMSNSLVSSITAAEGYSLRSLLKQNTSKLRRIIKWVSH